VAHIDFSSVSTGVLCLGIRRAGPKGGYSPPCISDLRNERVVNLLSECVAWQAQRLTLNTKWTSFYLTCNWIRWTTFLCCGRSRPWILGQSSNLYYRAKLVQGVSNVLLRNVFWNLQYEDCEGFLRTAGDRNLQIMSILLCVNVSLHVLHQVSENG
jgi:hypothetical protein